MSDHAIKAVLGPTNTGKTHLAIERMCGHSSGMIGFPLRLLAREVYDRVRAIKGDTSVALITGEERIEPPDARYFCCTVEAMDRLGRGANGRHAFVALDEAQLAADPERGHIFTDRLLHARGREETMILGSATLAPMVKALVPRAEMVERPRFSTLRHVKSCKLSRLPPRSAVVGFSIEQVYAIAEALRRLRGGAAVVMGALSPETRNKQVELFQSGEVDYIVATDAIGMGLNLDLDHVAFAALSKFDGRRKRRLSPAEMAQIAGRAGRHQRDGTFGTVSGMRGGHAAPAEFTDEEIYAIEEHRFAPLTHLFWREAEPRFDDLATLIADLEARPERSELRAAPEAIDLAVLRRLADDPIAKQVQGAGLVRRFWEACSLPDFRALGVEGHARFVARLWRDLREGYLGADYVAARIAELDRMQGDMDSLQGRIAAIRSWAYICQRPDWVLARDEMFARARAVEAKLSDALHARLTERFVNRRTTLLMKSLGQDGQALPVELAADGALTVDGEPIGRLEGFRLVIDPAAAVADRKMLLAAGEKALPAILAERAEWLMREGRGELALQDGAIYWGSHKLADIELSPDYSAARFASVRELQLLPDAPRKRFEAALAGWLDEQLAPLEPLRALAAAARDPAAGTEARALLHALIAGHGIVSREDAGLGQLPKEMRPYLRKLGVVFGALDVFAHALLKPAPRQLLHRLGIDKRPLDAAMRPVLGESRELPAGYRRAGSQLIRVDLAEKILRAAFEARAAAAPAGVGHGGSDNGDDSGGAKARAVKRASRGKPSRFRLDLALAISIGLEADNVPRLLGSAGFRRFAAKPLAEGAHGPPAPDQWSWRPRRAGDGARGRAAQARGRKGGKPHGAKQGKGRKGAGKAPAAASPARSGGAFDALKELLG